MAEKSEKKQEERAADKKDPAAKPAATAAAAAGITAMLSKTPVLLGAVMFLEAIVLFAGMKFLGGGARNASGADLTTESPAKDTKPASGDTTAKSVEILLLELRFPNKLSGRTFLYDVSIYISVKSDAAEKVKDIISQRDALIKDRVRTIIAQSDPDKLGGGSEPGLETLRRQVKYQLDEIIGEGMVDEVLVPRCIPYRTDF